MSCIMSHYELDNISKKFQALGRFSIVNSLNRTWWCYQRSEQVPPTNIQTFKNVLPTLSRNEYVIDIFQNFKTFSKTNIHIDTCVLVHITM